MQTNRFTVVVSSCDKYEDLWYPFFKILKSEWPQLEQKSIPIILNTEHKSFAYEGLNIRTLNMYNEGDNPSWTERLRRTLNAVETDYVIILLDDFFMQDKVKTDKIDQCVQWLDENPKISCFCFKETYVSKNYRDGKFEGFEKRPLFGQYKFNCQAAIWRKNRLISYLKKDENPWEWEIMGNWRSYKMPSHVFYSHIPGYEHVFPYTYDKDGDTFWGSGVFHGKWFVESVDPIFKKHGINIDYSIRGILQPDEFGSVKRKEDAAKWKQSLWFFRPAYIKIKDCLKKFIVFIKHIDHFF